MLENTEVWEHAVLPAGLGKCTCGPSRRTQEVCLRISLGHLPMHHETTIDVESLARDIGCPITG
jgi:hypothetical protein